MTNLSVIIAGRKSISSMSVRLVWPFVQLALPHQREELVSQLQEQFGLQVGEFYDPDTRVSMHYALTLLERYISERDLPTLGLLAARKVTAEHIGLIEYLASSSATLGEALRNCDRYIRLLGDGAHQQLDVRGDRAYARFWLDGNLVGSAATHEFAVAVRLNIARRIAGVQGVVPLEVHFKHSEPSDVRLHHRVFGCLLRFNMPVTQLVLAAEPLTRPLDTSEPPLNRLLEHQAKKMLERLPRSDNVVVRVRDMLNAQVELGETSATQFARCLGMSVRSLSRRLAEEGTSYRELLDERRKQAALHDLAHSTRPLAEIAQQLGFATCQSFHRAFRRWTGETAGTYRSGRAGSRITCDSGP